MRGRRRLIAAALASASFLTLPVAARAETTAADFLFPAPGTISPRLDADDNEMVSPPPVSVAAPVVETKSLPVPDPQPSVAEAKPVVPVPAPKPNAAPASPVIKPPDIAGSPPPPVVAPLVVASAAMPAPLAATLPPIAPAPPPYTIVAATPAARYAAVQTFRANTKKLPVIKGFDKKNAPLDLTADQLEHDEDAQTITAIGHVELIQAGQILHADKVIYHLDTDTAYAKGHVIISEPNGDVHFADEAQFDNRFGSGFVKGLQTYLADGGRFIAHDGTREGSVTTMNTASYTPCECDEGRKGAPAWQIKGKQMIYHQDQNSVVAKDAVFDVYGVPIAWTPYISFPDGQVKQKSGFLTPSFDYRSSLGAVITSNYYWAIAPDKDAELGTLLTSKKAPVLTADYRERFDQGNLTMSGSSTYADHSILTGPGDTQTEELGDQWRGHFFADGLWDINDEWRAGTDLRLTSDDEYLRQYNFSHQDVLTNQVYAERFSGRDYAVGRIMAFQDVRVGLDRTVQPNALPEIDVNMFGDPNAALGGRWNLDLSMLGLTRNGADQPVDRFVAQGNWERRYITDFGLVNTFDANIRGDAYYVDDHDPTAVAPNDKAVGGVSRFFPDFQATSSYPFAKPYQTMQAVVAPVAALTLSPTYNVNNSKIPNEDSQDVELTAQNLFDPDRFPGLDRIEDGSRATYGLRTGLYGYGGSYGNIFAGQSSRFTNNGNLFPQGSGLSGQTSDMVGEITAVYDRRYGASYGFDLDNRNLAPERHEFSAFADWNGFRVNTRYVYNKALAGTDLDTDRAQLEDNISYDFSHQWRVRAGAINDFGVDSGLRRATVGIDYFGCCVSFSLTAERNLTTDISGDSGTSVMFRIGLKGLGGFQTPEQIDKQSDGLWR